MAELVEWSQEFRGRAKRAWSDWAGSVPAWLVFLGGALTGAIVGLLAGASKEWSGGLIGLLGVVLGGAIAWAATFALERERRKSQITIATWVERVRTHQEALTWWHRVRDAALEDDAGERFNTISEARTWCIRNCLYMSQEARDGFFKACTAANQHRKLLDFEQASGDAASTRNRETNWERIESLYRVLIEGVAGHIPDEMVSEFQRQRDQEAEKR